MTDKVTNEKVEDVLSSIKRLVGDEGRNIPDLVPASRARKPGRLVLTDALRVSKPSADPKPNSMGKAAESVQPAAETSVKPMMLRASDAVAQQDPANQTAENPDRLVPPSNSLSAKIEALEAAIARTEDQWEPDGDSEDDYSGTRVKSLTWAADEKTHEAAPQKGTSGKAAFIRDPDAVVEQADTSVAPSERPDVTVPEDGVLRDMIAQIVREELQGVLGERITRNLRKMVRREIYRALSEQGSGDAQSS